MSIQTDLTRIKNAKAAIKAAIEGKGVTVPDATLLDGMAALIAGIESGGGGGAGAAYTGTVIFNTYTQVIDFGIEVPADNFFIAIMLNEATSVSMSANYIYHLFVTKKNGVFSGVKQNTSPSSQANLNSDSIVKVTGTSVKFDLNTCYFRGGVNYRWFMGSVA